ncbi:MAG: DUF1559 domain-containing protein, partial [Isosphaeraceae bacterium]
MRRKLATGYSLIEVLVAISVLGLLMALVLPAVQSARGQARRIACANNLRQVGVALSAYHDANGTFPQYITNIRSARGLRWVGHEQYFSPHVRLLPYLDQVQLYSGVNFTFEFPPVATTQPPPENSTAYGATISVFLCPSDGSHCGLDHGNNYRCNVGVGPSWSTAAESPDSGNGFFSFPYQPSAASFPDGLSHTVAFSERLRGSGEQLPITEEQRGAIRRDLSRDYGDLSFYRRSAERDADTALEWCRVAAQQHFPAYTQAGNNWFYSGREITGYTHAQEPNGAIPDALNMYFVTSFGVSTARSNHRGGVNAVMGDGSVRFVTGGVDRAVWRALGSRNG